MTEDERRRRGGKLCDKLQTEVDAIRSPQVTHSAGEVVASLDADFLIALTAWEGSGEEEDRFRVRDAYLAITDAWNASGLPDAARNEGRAHWGYPRRPEGLPEPAVDRPTGHVDGSE